MSLRSDPVFGPALVSLLRGTEREISLPSLVDVADDVLIRGLYREALDGRSWFPLVFVPAGCGADPLEELASIAQGGWLVASAAEHPDPGDGYVVIRPGEGEAHRAPDLAHRLARVDPWHLVAVDPSLDAVRRSLRSHCRSASLVHIRGPHGSGRRALVSWAHALLDDRPLGELGQGPPVAGRWLVVRDVANLGPDALHHLQSAVASRDPLSAPAAPPPGKAPVRPAGRAFAPILGESPALVAVLARAARVAPRPLPVLILGESGTGKESLARAVHDASGRGGPFVPVDLGALPDGLVESELFGHRRGAFTGADRDRLGAFRQAEGGTLFLDEVGNLELRAQAALLRALQERRVRPVGSDQTLEVDVRVVAATNADLESRVARGEFREDLLRRLDAVTLRLPPLRDRRSDLPLLARHFFVDAGGEAEGDWLSDEALAILERHRWPGNIRELANVMRQASTEVFDGPVLPAHLGPLAPRVNRPVPLITFGTDEGPWPLPPELEYRLKAVTLTVPPMRDRPWPAVRCALLTLLAGVPLTVEALELLERRPWWGNLGELESAAQAIRANLEVVDREGLEATLPYLLDGPGREPVRVVLHPTRRPDGVVTGLTEQFDTGALLLGRGTWSELETAARRSARVAARLDTITAALGTVRPAVLDLAHVPQISRAHALVTRSGNGLVLRLLPGVRTPILATRLDDGSVGVLVNAGEEVVLGPAAQLQIPGVGELPAVHLFAFLGRAAWEQYAEAAARAIERRGAEAATRVAVASAGDDPVQVWTLSVEECDLLNDIVAAWEDGSFASHLRDHLSAAEGEAGRRLLSYLGGSRPTQYCARLYAHPDNAPLREGLATRLAGQPQRLDALPVGIQRALASLSD